MNFRGVIIAESLKDQRVLRQLKIIKTEVEPVTPEHHTPWVKQWTLHTVEIPENQAETMARQLSHNLQSQPGNWYTNFKTDQTEYIIFPGRIFKIDRTSREQYAAATKYGISIGIPAYQVDFAPNVKKWER